jgi:hypothetical protein
MTEPQDPGSETEIAPVEFGVVQLGERQQITPGSRAGNAGELCHIGQGEPGPVRIERLDDQQAFFETRNEVAIFAALTFDQMVLHYTLPEVSWTLVALTPCGRTVLHVRYEIQCSQSEHIFERWNEGLLPDKVE